MIPISKNPTLNNNKTDRKVEIVRIAPKNQGVDIEFRCFEKYNPYIKLLIYKLDNGELIKECDVFSSSKIFTVDMLFNDVDYIAEVVVCDYDGTELFRSNKRLFRTGWFPGKVLSYVHPEDLTYSHSGRFLGSANITRLDNGTYIGAHDVFDNTGTGALLRFYVSKDYGKTWNYISQVENCTWANMFVKNGKVYVFGCTNQNEGDLTIYCSDDDCVSWSKPVVLYKHQKEFALRCAPVPFAEHSGRLWFYFNNYNYSDKAGFQTAVASVPVDSDYMNVKNWEFTPFLKFDSKWEGTVGDAWGPFILEEGNMIVNRDGELVMILRYNSHRYDIPESDPDKLKVIVLKVNTDNPTAPLEFKKCIPFNGTLSKFYIKYDEKSDLYYALVNRMTTNKIWQRNVLSLCSSYDLEKWKFERDLINLEDMEWYESNWDSGVQYPTWFIEGDDIIAMLRTAMNGADNFHNSNAITFHKFKNFRELYNF